MKLSKSWARVMGWIVRMVTSLIAAVLLPYPYSFIFLILFMVSFVMILLSAIVAYKVEE